jgi:hypothetical protein
MTDASVFFATVKAQLEAQHALAIADRLARQGRMARFARKLGRDRIEGSGEPRELVSRIV